MSAPTVFGQIQVATIDGRDVLARTLPAGASAANIGNLPRDRYLISTVSDRKQRTTVLISVE
jgi:hypothetical protein